MPKASTLLLRRLGAKRKIEHNGVTCYADATEVGTIIDHDEAYIRERNPFTLERFIPARRPPNPSGKLMAPDIEPAVWEVIENFSTLDRALQRGHVAQAMSGGATLRIRDRKTNDIIMCAIFS